MFQFYFNAIQHSKGAIHIKVMQCMLRCESLTQWERECLSMKGSVTVH